jgi:hypothetical protein
LIGYSGPNGETAQYPLNTYRTWYPSLFHHYHSPSLRPLLPPILSLFDRATPLGSPATLHWIAPTVGFFFLAFFFAAMETRRAELSFNWIIIP